jgi:hypothetical protein
MMNALGVMQTATTAGNMHDHLPMTTMEEGMLIMRINSGMPLTFTLEGMDGHSHTLTFTEAELTMLRNGGMVAGKVSSSDNSHTHTYTIECMA